MVHPHPGATSTKSSSLYYLGQAVTAQNFSDPDFAQDRRSAQLARSFFLALQHKTTTLALRFSISLQSCTKHLQYTSNHIDPATSTKPLSIHHIDVLLLLLTFPKYLFIDYKMGLSVGKPRGRHQPKTLKGTQK
jgi:hypothetical protein